jgi:hypothetical protein
VGGREDEAAPLRAFSVHEHLLIEYAEYFRAALEPGRWQEGTTKTVKMPEDKPEVFDLYVSWLYTRTLPTVPDHADVDADPFPAGDQVFVNNHDDDDEAGQGDTRDEWGHIERTIASG